MKKNIWILNHYASDMFINKGGRHLWFAQKLKEKGYNPIIICASTTHNSKEKLSIKNLYEVKNISDIPFLFIKCREYDSNNFKRLFNMIDFYRGLLKLRKKSELFNIEKPDIIYGSSVHPLTLVAGIKLAKFFNVECISEVRDLWPESIVAYSNLSKKNIIIRMLYRCEKWIYKKSDRIIMTWEGGYKYICDKGWDEIHRNKVFNINNGIVLEQFDFNVNNNIYSDEILNDKNFLNVVYTGSIRKVNDVGFLVDVAKKLDEFENNIIRILVYGAGTDVENICNRINSEKIESMIYMGSVEKKYIPSILTQSWINILHNKSTELDKYGQSQNKLFEYLASGKPVLQTYSTNFSIIEKYSCGVMCKEQKADIVVQKLHSIFSENNYQTLSENARLASQYFDYEVLTKHLVDVIENNTQGGF